MAIRAYRVKRIDTESSPTFNVWHEDNIVQYLGLYEKFDSGGGGLVGTDIENIENMLNDKERGFDIDPQTELALKRDILIEQANNNNYIEWLCC